MHTWVTYLSNITEFLPTYSTHIYTHVHVHTRMHAPLHAHEHTCILCVNIHAHTQAWRRRKHARSHTHMHTPHITTQMHARTQSHVLTSTHAAAYIYPTRQNTRNTNRQGERAQAIAHTCSLTHTYSTAHTCTTYMITHLQTRMHHHKSTHAAVHTNVLRVSTYTYAHIHTYTHTRPQVWRPRAPADSGQRHLAYIHTIMSNQSSSHTQKSQTFKTQSSHSSLNPNLPPNVQVVMHMLLAYLIAIGFLLRTYTCKYLQCTYTHVYLHYTQAWIEGESTHA